MARRRRNDDGAELVIKLVGLLLLLGFISPQGRQLLSSLGILAIVLAVLVILGLGIFIAVRHFMRSRKLQGGDASWSYQNTSVPPVLGNRAPSIFVASEDNRTAQKSSSEPDLIQQLHTIDWFQFEKVVACVYRKLGYSVERRGGANPDGGIDLVVSKDGETKAVQCKQWKSWNVGVKAVREFLGALTDAGIQRGIFITLRGYTGEAKQLADKRGIEIVNETDLASMLSAADAQLDPEVLAILQDTRKFCPKCEREMVLRTASKGPGAGQQFWGCSAYPRCRFTMPITT